MTDKNQDSYLVLARKYRSRTFGEMVGQDALVQTLSNAIEAGRIHHAYVLTGIRGTGKTTTARLLAMALNCENGPAIDWAEDDAQAKAIIEGKHVDVLEFDAASHTGVDDIKELFEGVAYAPVQGRYKVYIIDEVHMLSKQAFNALLKTLEEPPENVKFIFATTEVNKIPVTVLSRCQRFDLRRIPSDVLFDHYSSILEKENIKAEEAALKMIAKAADGSARDGLSLLDQAIATAAGGEIKTDAVAKMLGLADGALVYDLFEATLGGDIEKALATFNHMYIHGFDPLLVVNQLLQATHLITRIKVVPGLKNSGELTELEKSRAVGMAEKLKLENLARVYQMLLTAAREAKQADRPYEALEMALVRVSHLAALPSVETLIQQAQSGEQIAVQPQAAAPTTATAAPQPVEAEPVQESPKEQEQASLSSWEDVVKAVKKEKASLGAMLSQKGRVISFEIGAISLSIDSGLMDTDAIVGDLRKVLKGLTGDTWNITVSKQQGGETLSETAEKQAVNRKEQAAEKDDVKKILETFPGSELVGVSEVPPWEEE